MAQSEAKKAEEIANFLIELFEANEPSFNKSDTLTANQLLETGKAKINTLNNQPVVKARMLEVLGNIYGLLSKPEQADSLLEKSLKLKKQIHTPADPELASIYYSLAAQKHNLGYYKLCFALIDTAILYQTKIYGVQSREVGKSLTLLAESFRKAGHIDSAYTIINKSEMIFSALGDTTSEEYLRVLMELGAINVANGEIYDAEKIWRQTLGLSKKLFESPHPVIISNINGLSNVLKETEEFAEAEILYTKSLEMTNKVYGHMHLNTAAVLNNLASLYYYTENYSKADALYADSYEILKTILGENTPLQYQYYIILPILHLI